MWHLPGENELPTPSPTEAWQPNERISLSLHDVTMSDLGIPWIRDPRMILPPSIVVNGANKSPAGVGSDPRSAIAPGRGGFHRRSCCRGHVNRRDRP